MDQKLITFAVPCYNSAAYMRHCIETLLSAGERAEIILVDDGSVKDETPAICDEYAAKYPTIVKAIHQENGGHGEGVNQGIRNATGLYYKVVDSDDWLDTDALQKVLSRLHTLVTRGTAPDLMICNYVYEHTEDGTSHTVRYTNIFPQERLFTWMHVGHFRPDQNLLMHSVMYRTEVLRKCGMVLPKHTFYVDNIFVYQPLPFVKTMYYMDLDLYRYFIGRADQSVNESVMVKRVDQQLRVTRHMIDYQDLDALKGEKKLRAYMLHYLSMMMAVSDIFLLLDGSAEAKEKQKGLWQYLREHTSVMAEAMEMMSGRMKCRMTSAASTRAVVMTACKMPTVMACLCEARHQQTCDERRGKADEKLFHAILRAAARYRRAAALSSFFSVKRVSLLLAKSQKTQHSNKLYYPTF